jgi:pimeloyl-ACP methyl ester carboxylesterase
MSSRLLRLTLLLLVPMCIVSCSRDETPNSEAMPLILDSETASEDPAVAYANRVTKTDSAYREGYFEYEGLRLHYVEAGEGDLVIFYHGFPSYWLSFLDQMEVLKSQYRVVAVDGLGAGLSDKPDTLSAYRVEALAAQLDALARHLAGEEKFTLIGHDWGGALALTFAEAYPDRLKGVVGMSAPSYNVFLELVKSSEEQQAASSYMQRIRETPPEAVVEDPPGERLWRMGYGKLVEFGVLSEEEGELFRQALAPAEATNGGFNWYRANMPPPATITEDDYWPDPPARIRPPVLLIIGGDDTTFIRAYVDMMEATADDLTVVILPGIGHWTSMQDPNKSTQAIVDFLAGLKSDE